VLGEDITKIPVLVGKKPVSKGVQNQTYKSVDSVHPHLGLDLRNFDWDSRLRAQNYSEGLVRFIE